MSRLCCPNCGGAVPRDAAAYPEIDARLLAFDETTEARALAANAEGQTIYFGLHSARIKIGRTKSLLSRTGQHKKDSVGFRLLASVSAGALNVKEVEHELLCCFSDLALLPEREWFRPDRELVELVVGVSARADNQKAAFAFMAKTVNARFVRLGVSYWHNQAKEVRRALIAATERERAAVAKKESA